MKRDKKTSKTNSITKPNWLHIILIWGLILMIGVINCGCDKSEDVPDVYYVKYLISSSTPNSGGKLNVTINKENGMTSTLIIDQNAKWEAIIGPVSKGFNAEILTSNRTGTEKLHVYTEIDVSKNNSPFAYKVSDGPRADGTYDISTILKYAIDY